MGRSVGITIPAYEPDVPRLVAYVESLRSVLDPDEIQIELDAPRSDVLARRFAGTPVRVHSVAHRRGKGAAITDGFDRLDSDVLAFADADGSTPTASIAAVVDGLDVAALSVGSRRHPGAIVDSHQTVVRRFLGDRFAWVTRRLLDVELYDYQCGAKAIRCDAWRAVREYLSEPGFAWDVELLAVAAALGVSIKEVPVRWRDHPESTVGTLSTTLDLARALVEIRRRTRTLSDDYDRSAPDRTARSA